MTLFMEKEPVVPFMDLPGPALIALTRFGRTAFTHKAIGRLAEIKSVMNSHGVPIGSVVDGILALPDDVLEPMLVELGDHSFGPIINSMYVHGHPNVRPRQFIAGTTSDTMVKREITVKRMHIMFYNVQTSTFSVPDILDHDYGHLFYCQDTVSRVGSATAVNTHGEEFGAFVRWRKKMWRKANKLLRSIEKSKPVVKLGEAMVTLTAKSRIARRTAEDFLLEELRNSGEGFVSLAGIRNSDSYSKLLGGAYNRAVERGEVVSESTLMEYNEEKLAAFNVDDSFAPCIVSHTQAVTPRIDPFGVDPIADPIVFNGEQLPF